MLDLSRIAGHRVLVTGGFGFIGSNLSRRLSDLGCDVSIIDSLAPDCGGNRANLVGYENRIEQHVFDLASPVGLSKLVAGRRFVFHLAGRSSHMGSLDDPAGDAASNVTATLHLLDACRKYAPDATVVFASTRQIYGRPLYLPVDEAHSLAPVDVNGVNKIAAEAFHTLYRNLYGLKTVSLRLTNIFGPRMRIKDARQTFLGVWLRSVIEGQPFEVWGGEQRRDFTHVSDLVEAFLATAVTEACDGGIFNVGGTGPVSLLDLAESLVRLSPGARYARKAFPKDRKPIDIGDYWSDDRAFRDVTGWQPRISLEEGLGSALDYYRAHGEAHVG
jgi:UDP-glucose 4-epimerase